MWLRMGLLTELRPLPNQVGLEWLDEFGALEELPSGECDDRYANHGVVDEEIGDTLRRCQYISKH
jgi:hypothetical protein